MGIYPTDDRQLDFCVSTVSFLTEQVRLKQDDAVVAPGTIVDFSATGRATGYQVSGWARPEKTGTWTQDAKASLTALVVGWPLDDMLLQIIAQPFMVREGHPSLSVQVIANGTAVEQWTYSDEEGGGPAVRSALIPKSLFAASPILNIELRIEKPAVPSAMGIYPTDDRALGLFVSTVSFLTSPGHEPNRRPGNYGRTFASSAMRGMRRARAAMIRCFRNRAKGCHGP